MSASKRYASQAARDAQAMGYGSESYWDYLDEAERRNREYWLSRGDEARAADAMSRSLSEALRGNDGV